MYEFVIIVLYFRKDVNKCDDADNIPDISIKTEFRALRLHFGGYRWLKRGEMYVIMHKKE